MRYYISYLYDNVMIMTGWLNLCRYRSFFKDRPFWDGYPTYYSIISNILVAVLGAADTIHWQTGLRDVCQRQKRLRRHLWHRDADRAGIWIRIRVRPIHMTVAKGITLPSVSIRILPMATAHHRHLAMTVAIWLRKSISITKRTLGFQNFEY